MESMEKKESILGIGPEEIIPRCQLFDVMSLDEARELWEAIFEILEEGDIEEVGWIAHKMGQKVITGTSVEQMVEVTDRIWGTMMNHLLTRFDREKPLAEVVVKFSAIIRSITKEILHAALQHQRETIAKQIEAIKELSLPVVEVWDKVLALPIVGTLDSYRVRTMMEELLNRIVNVHARVVILDITGVGVVDTETANYLLRTAKAARLLGAEVVITGISPGIAQTLVQLGVDLGTIVTRATLKGGLEYAFNLLGLEVQLK